MTVATRPCERGHRPDGPPDADGNLFCADCATHFYAPLELHDEPTAPTTPPSSSAASSTERPTNLPPEFWTSRKELEHIREAAHARGRSADVVLAAVLARLAAMVDPALVFETGLGPGSLNLFAAIVAPSGVGKSTGNRVARDLLPAPRHLTPETFSDGVPLGSGEGLAEAFMGTKSQPTGEHTPTGKPRFKTVRTQVRRNAFFYVDEGEALIKSTERRGATIGSALRAAFGAEPLGQANATTETTRILPANEYALGLVVGFQRATALPLLDAAGPGTPQRFLWASAVDPSLPDEYPQHPGTLFVPLTDAAGDVLAGTIHADPVIRAELHRRNTDRVRGLVTDDDLDAHETYVRSKVAALLSLLDNRMRISLDDWELSARVWATSCGVRESLITHGRREAERDAQARDSRRIEFKERETAAVNAVQAKVLRVSERVARTVADAGGLTMNGARQQVASRDRGLFDAAVEQAHIDGLIVRSDSGLAPGLNAPDRRR